MSILKNAYRNIFIREPNTERPPAALMSGMMNGSIAPASQGGTLSQMQTYGNTGWIHAVVERIATSIASTDWTIYQTSANGDRQELFRHPLTMLWNSVNPYDTRETLMEMTQQHLELTGEAWWILLRNTAGVPQEIWCVRPDRMHVVPSREDFIAGYMYQLGTEKIPLEKEDVIFIKNPSPVDPYRGMGVVQSILADIDSERMAIQWTRNFFRNSAEPGGIIQFDEDLSDADFDRLVSRWREQHQGVGNAHRVAVLERGKWVDRKMTQRDMQFEQLRKLNRDTILGAFGMPMSVMGITESVNRANAEAGEVMFARWVLRPRLVRIRAALNEFLTPLFGTDLEFDFTDPTPANKEFNLQEATTAYQAGLITKNEARSRLGESEVDNGDGFKTDIPGFELTDNPGYHPEERNFRVENLDIKTESKAPVGRTRELIKIEQRMYRNWAKRLRQEANAIADHMEEFTKQAGVGRTKIEASDLEAYDWNWLERYQDDVAEELGDAFDHTFFSVEPELPSSVRRELTRRFAQQQSMRLLQPKEYLRPISPVRAEANLVSIAQLQARKLAETAVDEGWSIQQLRKELVGNIGFSPARAAMISRTETANASGFAAFTASKEAGKDEKQWVTSGVSEDPDCIDNGNQGWIDINQDFSSGAGRIPAHPNCECTVEYRTSKLDSEIPDADKLDIELIGELSTPQRSIKALPSNYREVGYTAEERCGSCRFYWNGYCEYWDDSVKGEYLCNSWADMSHILTETFCPSCQKRLPMNNFVGTADVVCPRCRTAFTLESENA